MANMKSHDFKDLEILLGEEKDVLTKHRDLIKEMKEANKFFEAWGRLEGPDLEDIAPKVSEVTSHLFESEELFTAQYDQYRTKLKEVKTREKKIHTLKAKVKTARETHKENVKKSRSIENSKIELEVLEEELAKIEAEHEGSKRAEIRDALRLKFSAYSQLAVKRPGSRKTNSNPTGHAVTSQIMKDFEKAFKTASSVIIPSNSTAAPAAHENIPSPTHPNNVRASSPSSSSIASTTFTAKDNRDSIARNERYERQSSFDSSVTSPVDATANKLNGIYITDRPYPTIRPSQSMPTQSTNFGTLPSPTAYSNTGQPPPHPQGGGVAYTSDPYQQQQQQHQQQQQYYQAMSHGGQHYSQQQQQGQPPHGYTPPPSAQQQPQGQWGYAAQNQASPQPGSATPQQAYYIPTASTGTASTQGGGMYQAPPGYVWDGTQWVRSEPPPKT
ncbi:hypothetical protein HDV05_003509 [Chytridiales sp. JEL 0842]|nr:hypothetical protein HDV05_003509 [Chytridiales sp. JEL 0842]